MFYLVKLVDIQPSDDKDMVESPYMLSQQPQDEAHNDTEEIQCEVVPARSVDNELSELLHILELIPKAGVEMKDLLQGITTN